VRGGESERQTAPLAATDTIASIVVTHNKRSTHHRAQDQTIHNIHIVIIMSHRKPNVDQYIVYCITDRGLLVGKW